MKTLIATVALLSTFPNLARAAESETWEDRARFFVGGRGSLAVPHGGHGPAYTGGLELGVAADSGVGFGLHLVGINNPPAVPSMNIPEMGWAFGAAADIRAYFQTVEPLTLYPTFSVGFLAGTDAEGTNVVMPMLNPGFGARMRFENVYVAFEIGAANFFIPFVALSLGFEPERVKSHGNKRLALSESGGGDGQEAAARNVRAAPTQFERAVPVDAEQDMERHPAKAVSED
jgi:hypothetical protein